MSFPFPPDDGEPLSKQQAGPEAGVTVGRVGCHVSWGLLEGGTPAGPKDTPPWGCCSILFSGRAVPGEEKAAGGSGQGPWQP